MIPSFFVLIRITGEISIFKISEKKEAARFTGERCHRLRNEIYVPSGYTCDPAGHDAYDKQRSQSYFKRWKVIGENQKISVLDALKAVTIYAAYQYFEEHEKGSIECGKYADFVVLEKNPLKTPKEELAEIKVWMTIKENEVIYRSGEANHE